MKRDNRGVPVMMVHRWDRPSLSCRTCRAKKRRCDRNQPCSSCTQRNIDCSYGESNHVNEPSGQAGVVPIGVSETSHAASMTSASQFPATRVTQQSINENMLLRLSRLEENMFNTTIQSPQLARDEQSLAVKTLNAKFTPFGLHSQFTPQEQIPLDVVSLIQYLPPLNQAHELFDHFARTVQPTVGILHMPSARDALEQTYKTIAGNNPPELTSTLLLFTLFAGSALTWNNQLLRKLNSTVTEAKNASKVYTRLATSILDACEAMQPSTLALATFATLGNILQHSDGFPTRVQLIHSRCFSMARSMQIHRLDTAKSQEERRSHGSNTIDVEVQRRIWWNMVASDWLSSFSGGLQEGWYIFHPEHMNVEFPSNVDDDAITSSGLLREPSPLHATALSGYICRLQMATLCREAVDALSPTILQQTEPDYDLILKLDGKMRQYLRDLPTFFQIDEDSIKKSSRICEERPFLAFQRTTIHFSLHTRLCRLHRTYQFEGMTNAAREYSRTMCVQSAQTVLDLRRAMDRDGPLIGLNPARSWTTMQHVFLAALVLATDVSLDPNAHDAEARKAKVLSAYETLEKSREESSTLTEGIQRKLQAILATLPPKRVETATLGPQNPPNSSNSTSTTIDGSTGAGAMLGPDEQRSAANGSNGDKSPSTDWLSGADMGGDQGWDQMWSDFLSVAGELEAPQWSLLVDDMDFFPS